MKATDRKTLAALASVLFTLNVFAQIPPGGGGGGGTNNYAGTNNFTPMPYVPGLKLFVPGLSGTNLPINLLEADPAGTYDVFTASNLIGAAWNDVLQGTNGQTNFTLPTTFTNMGFFRVARTDTPVFNTAGMIASFPNNEVNTNLTSATISGGPAAALAVLVNDTNLADAVWIPFNASPNVLLGTNDGTYQIMFGFIGSDGQTNWTTTAVTMNTTPPLLFITSPTNPVVMQPFIQITGFSPKTLAGITYDLTNAGGILTNQQGLLIDQFFDTNLWKFTTNYFQAFDVPLTNGLNLITLHATDLAGNTTTITTNITVDYFGKTNPPAVQIGWPTNGTQISGTNFTLDGQVDDPTVTVVVSITDTAGDTNVVTGAVERTGKIWVEEIPLNPGTNALTLTVTDAAGNTSVTNISVVQSSLVLTVDSLDDSPQLWQPTVSLTGTISDSTYAVWVNGVKGTNKGTGTWSANNVPVNSGGTASFTATAYAPDEQQPDGSYGN